jgi:hypothetical protein
VAKKNPTSVIGQQLLGSLARLQEIQRSNKMRQGTLLKSVGINDKSKQPESNPMEGKTATNSMGHKVIFKNGKWQETNG